MNKNDNAYVVEVLEAHTDWGIYRNPTNREPVEGESYVKIPASEARKHNIIRGREYTAHFKDSDYEVKIKAAGNGPYENKTQYAKQFEGVGKGACKTFTPWYKDQDIQVGDEIKVEFLSETDIMFSKL